MLKQFYEKALPSQGVYCVSGLINGRMSNRFTETLDGVLEEIEKLKGKKADVFVALGTFEGYSRKADDCLFVRSFFIDLDVGEGKGFATKEDAHAEIESLLLQTGLTGSWTQTSPRMYGSQPQRYLKQFVLNI